MWLILPCLQRRVEGGKADATETKVVDFVKSNLPVLLLGGDEADQGEKKEEPTETAAEKEAETEEVTGAEVMAMLMSLNIPGLFDPASLAKSGFTVRQQTALLAQFGGRDAREGADNFSTYLTRAAWNDMKSELKLCTSPPTKASMVDGSGPWNKVLRAFIRSPRVNLRTKTRYVRGAPKDDLRQEWAERNGGGVFLLKRKRTASMSNPSHAPPRACSPTFAF